MGNRISIKKSEPGAYKALGGLAGYVEGTQLTRTHRDLINIRTSQLNGCAYCIDQHTREAREAGESERRIYALNAWRETPFFDEKERAILALTEAVTFIHKGVSNEMYQQAATVLDEHYLAAVIMAIINMNAWNRLGISTGMQPAQ
jgi:AhpD family alkylhydroperoxidase